MTLDCLSRFMWLLTRLAGRVAWILHRKHFTTNPNRFEILWFYKRRLEKIILKASMNNIIEILVPDIGNFESVDVIEVLVKAGDVIVKDDSLITLESDKASMDIPSSQAGTVKELKVKVGDKVAKGSLILLLEIATSEVSAQPALEIAVTKEVSTANAVKEVAAIATAVPASGVSANSSAAIPASDLHAEVLVLGSGPGGYTAAFRAADLGKK